MVKASNEGGPVETTPLVSRASSGQSRVSAACHTFLSKQSRTKERVSQPFAPPQVNIVSETSRAYSGHSTESSDAVTPNSATSLQCESAHWQASSDATHRCPPSVPSSILSWLSSWIPSGVSLRLENSGSVARDHLASERTFLAYMRTSLAIASSGVALVQLFTVASAPPNHLFASSHRLHAYVRPLGATTVVIGLLVLIIGVTRYFRIQAALKQGYFPAARVVTGAIALALGALVTLTFTILAAGKLEPKGR